MEVEDIHASKRSRMGLGGVGPNADSGMASTARVGRVKLRAEEEEDGEGGSFAARGGGGSGAVAGVRGLRPWQQHPTASRIYRVSRASGGKDRHSKVMTARGLRDRRIRLSVSTAIQFYDLQDRLGYDQPSKAIEWLIKAAAAAISELPALDGVFSDQPPPSGTQQGGEEKPAGAADEDEEDDSQFQYANHHRLQLEQEEHQSQQRPQQQQQQRLSLTKSTCSSTSETSKGSVLSLSRSEIRVKARERARERTATAKDKEDMEDDAYVSSAAAAHHKGVNPNPITSQSSFTELLTGGGHQNHHSPVTVAQPNFPHNFIHKHLLQLPASATAATTTDHFGQVGLLGTGQKQPPTLFPAQTHFGNSGPMGMVPFNVATAATSGDHPEVQQQQQHYMQEHLIPFAVAAAGGDYINFSISSGFNRGTLQSNTPSALHHHHLQMFSSPVDGSNVPFFLGAAAAQAASAAGESQLHPGLDSRLQLCYRHPDQPKDKGKN